MKPTIITISNLSHSTTIHDDCRSPLNNQHPCQRTSWQGRSQVRHRYAQLYTSHRQNQQDNRVPACLPTAFPLHSHVTAAAASSPSVPPPPKLATISLLPSLTDYGKVCTRSGCPCHPQTGEASPHDQSCPCSFRPPAPPHVAAVVATSLLALLLLLLPGAAVPSMSASIHCSRAWLT